MIGVGIIVVDDHLVHVASDDESTHESLHIVFCAVLASSEKLQMAFFDRFLLILLLAYRAAIQVDNVVERRVLHFLERAEYNSRFGREIVEFKLS